MDYQTIRQRLTPEARDLFLRMIEVHNAGTGHRRFMHLRHLGGSHLQFVGAPGWSLDNPDGGALDDLAGYGLLRPHYEGRDPQYSVSAESLAFYRWFMEQEGTPIAQIELNAIRLIDDAAFASRHPKVTQHLGKAFDLLRAGETDHPTTSEIGGHLRSAMFELVSDIVDDDGEQEKPVARLKDHFESEGVTEREKRVLNALVDLAEAALSLDQRLTHIRDEEDKAVPLRGWDEVRRAAFITAFVLHELDRAVR